MHDRKVMQTLRCVVCGDAELSDGGTSELGCSRCGTVYPVIAGIPVLMSRPTAKVQEEHRRFQVARSRALAKAKNLEAFVDDHPRDSAAPRLRRMAAGIRANQGLADELFEPVADYLSKGADAPGESLHNFLYQAMALGYDFEILIAYLFQDWAGGASFAAVRDRVLRGVSAHAEHPEEALVLGSGAGGLAHALAGACRGVTAIDLSLPAQLLAHRMIHGGDGLEVHLFKRETAISSENDCAEVRLPPPPEAEGRIRLICGDAGRLPCLSAKTSLVVTQYLLDLVQDLERVVGEIHRVLAPGGLWINFGLPFQRAGEEATVGSRGHDELVEFFPQHGFELCEMDRVSFGLLDRSTVLADAALVTEYPLFFVARKREERDEPEESRRFFEFFSGRGEEVLGKVPLLRAEMGLTESEVYASSGKRSERGLWLGAPGSARPVGSEQLAMIRGLLENIGHGLSIGQLASGLSPGGPDRAQVGELVEVFRFLTERKILALG